ncbi:MAG TPA: apolipoprotein N-acyltransferase [Blastocatellia bacterium]|nr:apolipoprotein N-acyltransferase [Blastocatellia bacterium]
MTIEPRRFYPWLAAIASGVLLVFSFPKFAFGFLAWIALVPLLFVLVQPGLTWRRAFFLGWTTGFVFFFFSCNWITHSMIRYGGMNVLLAYAATALFTAITGLFPALFAVLTARVVQSFGLKALGLAPFLWAATEWLRGVVTSTTWNELGVSQAGYYTLAQFASAGGVALVGAFVVAFSVLLVWLPHLKQPGLRQIAILYLVVVIIALYGGASALSSILSSQSSQATLMKGAEVAVAGVQPNLPVDILTNPDAFTQRNNNGLETNLRLTREAINQAPGKKTDLIVWAESPLVLNYEQDEAVRNKLNSLAQEHNAHLVFSALGREGENVYNSVQTITPNGKALQRYDKIRLVPFGEYVPFRAVLGYFVPAMVGDFTPGKTATVNSLKLATQFAVVQSDEETQGEVALERTTNFIKVGTFICYEAAYANIVRQFVNNGATLLINVSDDAWFGNSAGAEQHLNHARMRAIETHRDLVRVTNSGISALITAEGKVVDPLPMFTPASRVWVAETSRVTTLYTKYGDWFAISCAIISALAILASFLYHSRAPEKSQI